MLTSTLDLPDLAATQAFAARLARMLRPGDCLALQGNLGAGKTALARALVHALCGDTPVPSPTFSLVQSYDSPQGRLWHFDLYRLRHPDELDELNWDEAQQGIMLVEWPDRAEARLPTDHLFLHMDILPNARRRLTVTAPPAWSDRVKDLT